MTRRRFMALLAASAASAACGQQGDASSPLAVPSRLPNAAGSSIVVAIEGEPPTLVPAIGGARSDAAQHLFDLVHQSLVSYDDQARPVARVARALPSLDDGTWRVHDDGTMETVWRLRNDVRWHDGELLTADDLIFSWRVFSDPAVPIGSRRVARLIESVESPDPHTIVIRWRSRYAFADQITGQDLTILPSHLLEASFDLRREQLVGHPYWRGQFVGLGPFKVASWGGGAINLEAFHDYFLGPPLLDAISVRFMADDNTAMAGVLGGAIDVLLPRREVQGVVQTFKQRWSGNDEGVLSVLPAYSWVFLSPQLAGSQPEDLQDPRVREALMVALDRSAIAEAVTGDRTLASELWLPTTDPRYGIITSGLAGHPYDPARARDLFRDAGWRREAADDVLVKQGRRFELEITTTQEWERTSAAVAEYWREAGVVVKTSVLTRSAVTDRQGRATYSGVELMGGQPSLALIDGRLNSANSPSAETLFVGGNRGHYSSREVDAALDRVWTTLDQPSRDQAERALAEHISTDLPIIGLFFYPAMAAARRNVKELRIPATVGPLGQSSATWNAHQWRTG